MRFGPTRVIGLIGLAGLVGIAACSPPDREAEVRAFLDESVAAAESRNTGFFRAHIDEAYRDAYGRDRDQLVDAIRAFFFVNQRVEVISRVESIELDGDDFAVVVLQAAVIGGRGGLDIDAELRRVELELARDGSSWTVIGSAADRLID